MTENSQKVTCLHFTWWARDDFFTWEEASAQFGIITEMCINCLIYLHTYNTVNYTQLGQQTRREKQENKTIKDATEVQLLNPRFGIVLNLIAWIIFHQHHSANYLFRFWIFFEGLFAEVAAKDLWCRGEARPLERICAGQTPSAFAKATAGFNRRRFPTTRPILILEVSTIQRTRSRF